MMRHTIIILCVFVTTPLANVCAHEHHQRKERHRSVLDRQHHLDQFTQDDLDESQHVDDMTLFRKENLNCHNNYRRKHHAHQLHPSHLLDKYAQKLAEELAARGVLEHSGGPHGENLYMSTGNVDGDSACNYWYSEVKDYNYSMNNPHNFFNVGHFTQMVWKDTKKVGVGKARSPDGKIIVVANYSPPGNFRNQYKANVSPK